MKQLTNLEKPKASVNPKLKSNSTDPYIQKKVEKATQLLSNLKKPL